jgi:ribosomal protein S18 acetylase RimI-like enzyme
MTSDRTPPFVTRPARPDEIEALYAIHRNTMRDYVAQTYGEWDEDDQAERFRGRFTPGRYEVIEVEGELAGYIDCEREPAHWNLNNIRVAPQWQSHGIGTALIRTLIARADEEDVPVELSVLRVNPARTLYERLGFRVAEENETHFRMRREVTSDHGST